MLPFVHQSLLWWGLPLVGLPVLIHLINLVRHRHIKWAAMEFLIQSQKRHRTWIMLQQLLLLLLRVAAVAAVVLMIAQPLVRNQWGALFGGVRTHHIVLLDDSFSMTDRWAATSAFDQAKDVVTRLGSRMLHQDTPQALTLLRFSRVGRLGRGTPPDLLQEPVRADFSEKLAGVLGPLEPSQTAAGPNEALEAVERLPGKSGDENRIVYIISDFRTKDWNEPAVLRKSLERLERSGAQIHLVNCVETAHANLAITALHPGPGTRAAGVPLMMEVSVINYGTSAAKEVSVSLEEDGNLRPAVVIESIPPGKNVTRRFPVLFSTAGEHRVAAHLPSDSIAADNVRYDVVDIPDVAKILVIDGDSRAQDAYFLSSALAPGGNVKSGLAPVIEVPSFLRDHPLDKYTAIYLLNIARLDQPAIEALEEYVRNGGGVAFFMGELCRAEFFNRQLYREGKGLFPLPLTGPTELLVNRLERTPDMEVTDHPIFAIFAGERNSFLGTVTIERYFAAPKGWAPAPDSLTRVIARLRNKAPLAVEHRFGSGRVIAFLSKAAPVQTATGSWNNWGRDNPSYVVALLEMQAYLAASRQADDSHLVGTPLRVQFDPAHFQHQVRFVSPQGPAAGTLAIDAAATPDGMAATLTDTASSGVYEAQLTSQAGEVQVRRYAFDVAPEEGDLKKLDGPGLAAQLAPVHYQYHEARDLDYDTQRLAGFNLGESLLCVLIIMLIAEQLLAYAASYHAAPLWRAAR